jgi:SAM-dependent methyltransferase
MNERSRPERSPAPPAATDPAPRCRACGAALAHTFLDLGVSPLANAFLEAGDLERPESFYPLHVRVCAGCLLVQLPAVCAPEEIFGEYAYFSSYSESWLRHAEDFAAAASERLRLGGDSLVVEVASNDGYLLRFFQARGIPVLGVEPAGNVAAAARAQGIPTLGRFFGHALARELVALGKRADLLVGNNVLAHVPDLNDFVAGLAALLSPSGTLSLEFPHLLRLMTENQFDTIYHEHFSYFSFAAARRILGAHGLAVVDVEELPTHGGSLRLWARPDGAAPAARMASSGRVEALLVAEEEAGLGRLETYLAFGDGVSRVKREVLRFLLTAQEEGGRVAGYGAPAKANTLLNYCGVGPDLLPFTVDRSPHKQGRFLPGTRIPIRGPERITETRPDYLWILPWNLRDEICRQMAGIREWGGRFLVAIPRLEVIP